MVGTKLPILLAFTISSLSAELITVNLSGVTTGGDYVVTQNSYSGLYSGLPSDFGLPGDPASSHATIYGTGTAWTAQFMYDTALMPASILSNLTGLNGSDPITTYLLDSASLQYATATFTIGGFTFNTAATAMDTPPTAGADQFTSINWPQAYTSRVAYGNATNYNAQGFHGYSGVETGYTFNDNTVSPTNPSTLTYYHIGALSFHIYQDNAEGPLFTGSGIPTSFSFTDTGVPFPASHYGYGYSGFYNSLESYTNVNGQLLLTTSYLTGGGADLVVTSAVTAGYHPTDTDSSPVPEPSTLVFGAIGSALIAVRRLRRN